MRRHLRRLGRNFAGRLNLLLVGWRLLHFIGRRRRFGLVLSEDDAGGKCRHGAG